MSARDVLHAVRLGTGDDGSSLVRVVRSEIIKFRSLLSLVWLTSVGAVVQAVLGPVQAVGLVVADAEPDAVTDLDGALSLATSGTAAACVVFGIAGVLTVTSEYPQKAIRGTFTATPRRTLVVIAKLLAYAAVVGPAAAVGSALAVAGSLPGLAAYGFAVDVLDPDVLRVVATTSAYLVLWGVYGQVLGWLLRSSVGATMALLSLFFVLPSVVGLLPRDVADTAAALLPSTAAEAMRGLTEGPPLGPAAGSCVTAVHVVLGVVVAARWVSRHDA